MSRPSEIILLCEDKAQSSLVIGYLKRSGFHLRSIRALLTQHGAGEQWVRVQYPLQVNAYRLANARKQTNLIVITDADKGTLSRRIQQLDKSLKASDDSRLQSMDVTMEKIARLIPRRNVETWILALNDTLVDEKEDYKHTRSEEEWTALIPSASQTLYDWTRPNFQLPDSLIESLHLGIQELSRVFTKTR